MQITNIIFIKLQLTNKYHNYNKNIIIYYNNLTVLKIQNISFSLFLLCSLCL